MTDIPVKKIALTYYCPNIFFIYDIPIEPTRAMLKGAELHEKLNFNNQVKYTYTFKYYRKIITLVGIPDKVGEKYVFELKTGNKYMLKLYRKAWLLQLKLYILMTGKPGILLEYDTEANKFIKATRIKKLTKKETRQIHRHIYHMMRLKEKVKVPRNRCRYCIYKKICGNRQLTYYLNPLTP